MKAWTNVRSWAGVLSSRGRPYPPLSGHRPPDHLNGSDVSVNGHYRRRSCGHLIGESANRTSTQDSSYASRTPEATIYAIDVSFAQSAEKEVKPI